MTYTYLYTLTTPGKSSNLKVGNPANPATVNASVSDTADGTNDGVVASGGQVVIGTNTYTYTGQLYNGDPIVTDGTTYFLFSNDGAIASNTSIGSLGTAGTDYTVCFLPGTLIATPEGQRAIETLAIGDRISFANGGEKPIKWIGEMTVNLSVFNRHTASPILIRAGALGYGLPRRDLYTSYHHGFELEGVLVIAGVLVNGTSIIQCSDWPEQTLKFYQLEVEGHELMLAEGAAAETFGEDADNRALFDNAAEFHALYPDAAPAEQMSLGRVCVVRQLPRAVKARIEAAALKIGYVTAAVA